MKEKGVNDGVNGGKSDTKGERTEDDEGPSPENNRDDEENRREGLATLLRPLER